MAKEKKLKNYLKRFWKYVWYGDSVGSYVLNFVLAFLIIKYIFFPGVGFIFNSDFPIVAIVSGSMEHKIVDHRVCDVYVSDVKSERLNFDEWWDLCGNYYSDNFNLTDSVFGDFRYRNGLNRGDVMMIYGKDYDNIGLGDVLVFVPEDKKFFEEKGPVIHRVVDKWQDGDGKWHFQTKGDHNPVSFENFEDDIGEESVLGVGILRVPFIGYVRLLLNEVIMIFRGVF